MKISDIDPWVRTFVRNGSDSSRYSTQDVQRAVLSLASNFISSTTWLTTSDLALTAGTATLPAFPTGFTPDRLRRARIVLTPPIPPASPTMEDPRVNITDFGEVYNRLVNFPQSGMPQLVGFDAYATGSVWPTPDQNYTLRFVWLALFPTWTLGFPLALPIVSSGSVSQIQLNYSGTNVYPGSPPTITFSGGGGSGATATAVISSEILTSITVTGGGTGYTSTPDIFINGRLCTDATLPLPDDVLMDGILTDGARWMLQQTEPENAGIVAASKKSYLEFVERMKDRGAGTLGEQVSYRTNPRAIPFRRRLTGWLRG